MKVIISLIFVLITTNIYASQKTKCEELFKSAIANFYIENSCKFDKHVSSSIRKEFEAENCTKLFNDADMKNLNGKVLGDSYKKMKAIGRDEFCEKNKMHYDELSKRY